MTNREILRPLNIGRKMIAPPTEIRSLLKQVGFENRDGKDYRLQASCELRKILCSLTNMQELSMDWKEMAEKLWEPMTTRTVKLDVKRDLAVTLSALGVLTADQFNEFLKLIDKWWKSLRENANMERSLIATCLLDIVRMIQVRQAFLIEPDLKSLLERVISYLDQVNEISCVTPLIQLAVECATIAPTVFMPHFQDVVDIAVGWLVEEGSDGLTPAKLAPTKNAILALGPLWLNRLDLLTNLTKQFVEDISTYLDKMKKEVDGHCAWKVKGVGGVLALCIRVCISLRTYMIENGMNFDPVMSLVRGVVAQMFPLMEDESLLFYLSSNSISLVFAVYVDILSECITFFADDENIQLAKQVMLLAQRNTQSPLFLQSVFSFLTKMGEECPEGVVLPVCSHLFSPSSLIHSLRFPLRSSSLRNSFILLLKTLLNPAVLSILQLAYAAVYNLMCCSVDSLLEGVSGSDVSHHEGRLAALISALRPILIVKNSLIVMLGLTPSLFEFFLTKMYISTPYVKRIPLDPNETGLDWDPLSTPFIERDVFLSSTFPSLHLALLSAIHEHCAAHDYFVATCDWLSSSSTHLGQSLTSRHTAIQLQHLAILLSSNHLVSRDARRLVSLWIKKICEGVSYRISIPAAKELLHSIREAHVIHPQTTSSLGGVEAMLERVEMDDGDSGAITRAILHCHDEKRTQSLWEHVRVEGIVKRLRMDLDTSNVYSTPLLVTCSPSHFELLTNFLLKRIPPVETANAEKDDKREEWLLCSSEPLEVSLVWRRRLLSAAAFCIESRMTTPLGKPKDTLQAFQSELQRLARNAVGEKDDEGEMALNAREEWFRIRCLLEFIEMLERMIYIAHSGSHSPVYTPSSTSRMWFVTNQTTCSEWFGRVFPAAMAIAFHSAAYSQVVRFGWSALPELERKKQIEGEARAVPSALIVIGWLVRALAEKGDAASIEGAAEWGRETFPTTQWEWTKGAEKIAMASFEDAVDILQHELSEQRVPHHALSSVQEMLLSALYRIREDSKVDEVKMEGEAMEKCKALCLNWKMEGKKVEKSAPKWDLHKGLLNTELWLRTTLKRSQVETCRSRLSSEGALSVLWDDDGLLTARYAAVSRISTHIMHRMEKTLDENRSPYASVDSLSSLLPQAPSALSFARQLLTWHTKLGGPALSPDTHLNLARLARKTNNGRTMECHLRCAFYHAKPAMALKVQLQRSKMARLVLPSDEWNKRKMDIIPILAEAYNHQHQLQLEAYSGNPSATRGNIDLGEAFSRATLNLASWLNEEDRVGERVPHTKLHYALEAQGVSFEMAVDAHSAETGLDEKGTLLSLAVTTSPSLAKAHKALADHVLFLAESGKTTDDHARNVLSAELGPDEAEGIVEALVATNSMGMLDEVVRKHTGKNVAIIERSIGVEGLIASLWADMKNRKTSLLKHSLMAYFEYLKQLGSIDGMPPSVSVVSSTLRILRIIVNYAQSHELMPFVYMGLKEVDEGVFKAILPQLFARLSHPVRLVRTIIVDILKSIGHSAPHAICYQAIVGAAGKEVYTNELLDVEEGEQELGVSHSKDRDTVYECCRLLEMALNKDYPQLVQDVKLFVQHLQRLNMTDERWSFVLTHLDADMGRRLRHVKSERERTMGMASLTNEKKRSIVKEKAALLIGPVYGILEDLWLKTKQAEESGVEDAKRFMGVFGAEIEAAFKESREERGEEEGEEEAKWFPFKKLCANVVQRSSRKGGHLIDIRHVAPRLIEKIEWCVPLPGQEDVAYSEVVTLHSISPHAQVLATKTRPKKLSLKGSDGLEQSFLFKGHEDLHLDERIMQLLSTCNLVLASRSKREFPAYTAHHYAVTPLGTLSGLIQWVGGATPLYQIYRRWQQRETLRCTNGKVASDAVSLRPMEMYHKKLKQLFVDKGIDPRQMAQRRNWPSEMLKELFLSLKAETPKDLISREMWLRSSSAGHWLRLTNTFARSTAVMAMIGSLLGLGDRHLDNLLLDLEKAHLIHIDYNVCFDKGTTLKVPETVPFRLTQNIVHALGVTQTKGVFSVSCRNVLASLREHSSLFSSLLDAFLYDPLVDWTGQKEHITSNVAAAVALVVYGDDKKQGVNKQVAKRLFVLRMEESRELLVQTRDAALNQLSIWRGEAEKGVNPCPNAQDAISVHSLTMSDLHPLLKTIAAKDEIFTQFISEYKRAVNEPVNAFLALSQDTTITPQEIMERIPPIINVIEKGIVGAYEGLFLLEQRVQLSMIESGKEEESPNLPPGFEEAIVSHKEENPRAASIVRKIIARLEGRVENGDPTKILSPQEHASRLISEASSDSALSLMYEGWTAWV